jgi:hypothetical protein
MEAVISDEKGQEVVVIDLPEKTYSSGKVGFWGQQRFQYVGKSYQAQVQVVELKPKKAE